MAQFRGFTGLRTYTHPLNRDLRELERYLGDLDERVAGLISSESIGSSLDDQGVSNLVAHARTHATKVDANTGTDPLDRYYMKWRKKQLIEPDLAVAADVPFQVKGSSASQTGDMVNLFNRTGDEAYTLTALGISAFGAAPEVARVNVQNTASSAGPDEISSASPRIWFRAEDITGVGDGNDSSSTPLPEAVTTNFVTSWTDGPLTNVRGAIYRSAPTGFNGNPAIEQRGTGAASTDLALGGTTQESSFSDAQNDDMFVDDGEDFTLLVVYRSLIASGGTGQAWRALGSNSGTAQGVSVPNISANAAFFVSTSTGAEKPVPAAVGVDCQGIYTRIAILRRDNATADGYVTNTNGNPESTATATVDGSITFNALLRQSDGSAGPVDEYQVAEIVLFDGYVSDADRARLYQWAAVKYGLSELSGSDLFHCYDTSDNTVFVIDDAGYTGIGTSVDPSIRLQVRDTVEQLRLEYDASNYASFTVADDGALTFDATGTDAEFFFTDKVTFSDHIELAEIAEPGTPGSGFVKIYAKTDGLLYSKDDAGNEYNLTDTILRETPIGSAPSRATFKVLEGPPDKLYVSMQKTGGTWTWVPIVSAV